MQIYVAAILLIILLSDAFLFVTGNPSATTTLFGGNPLVGWLLVMLVVAVGVAQVFDDSKSKQLRRAAVCLACYGVFLFFASLPAKNYAEAELFAAVKECISLPNQAGFPLSQEDSDLLDKIRVDSYVIERKIFIASARVLVVHVVAKSGLRCEITATRSRGSILFSIACEPKPIN